MGDAALRSDESLGLFTDACVRWASGHARPLDSYAVSRLTHLSTPSAEVPPFSAAALLTVGLTEHGDIPAHLVDAYIAAKNNARARAHSTAASVAKDDLDAVLRDVSTTVPTDAHTAPHAETTYRTDAVTAFLYATGERAAPNTSPAAQSTNSMTSRRLPGWLKRRLRPTSIHPVNSEEDIETGSRPVSPFDVTDVNAGALPLALGVARVASIALGNTSRVTWKLSARELLAFGRCGACLLRAVHAAGWCVSSSTLSEQHPTDGDTSACVTVCTAADTSDADLAYLLIAAARAGVLRRASRDGVEPVGAISRSLGAMSGRSRSARASALKRMWWTMRIALAGRLP